MILALVVKAEGSLNATLWLQPDASKEERGQLIQKWSDIHVTKKYYTEELGLRVRLEYSGYTPHPREHGILEVTLIMPDGKSFSFEEANVRLGISLREEIRGQPPPVCCP